MDEVMKTWIATCMEQGQESCYFCSNIGLVYTGLQPAMILSVTETQLNLLHALETSVRVVVLYKRDERYGLFVYHPNALSAVLTQAVVRRYLTKLGYPESFRLGSDLAVLTKRLREGEEFPHEIGFFLGYPVKDVLGFMGIVSLPLVQTRGWQMYGTTRISEQLYRRRKEAKSAFLHYAVAL